MELGQGFPQILRASPGKTLYTLTIPSNSAGTHTHTRTHAQNTPYEETPTHTAKQTMIDANSNGRLRGTAAAIAGTAVRKSTHLTLLVMCWCALAWVTTGPSPVLFAMASSYADGGPDMACWKAKLMVPCDKVFPGVDIQVDWAPIESPKRLVEGDMITIPSHIIVPPEINLTTTDFKDHEFDIDHANLHACKVSGGFCSPFVSASPGLVTHSPALQGSPGRHNPIYFDLELEPGDWTFITHYRFFIDDNIRCDFAKGQIVHVDPLLIETIASPTVITVVTSLAVLGMLLSFMFLTASYIYRKTNVFKLASWKFCALASLGGMTGNACILLWIPPLSDIACALRPFLLPIAFDIIFFPLLLKTWRLKVLLVDNASSLKKVKVSDFMLLKGILLPTIFDVALAACWMVFDRPQPQMVMSLISDSRYEIYCVSQGTAFMILALLVKVPFVLWGLKLAWATRAIISVMNESSYIMLSMINLFFVGAYVLFCRLQFNFASFFQLFSC